MLPDLVNLALRPFRLSLNKDVGLIIKGTVDEVRQQTQRLRFIPFNGVEIIGYTATNGSCDFLRELKNIEYCRIFAAPLSNIQSIQMCSKLRYLSIEHVDKKKSIQIDFSCLPLLEHLNLEWFNGAETIFKSNNIRCLSINRYPLDSFEPFLNLTDLRSLRFMSATKLKSIVGLRKMNGLVWLALLNNKNLHDYESLRGNSNIKFLWIEGGRNLNNLDFIGEMKSLETLRIINCGKLERLTGLSLPPKLRHIHIHNRLNEIESLSFLAEASSLENVYINSLPEKEACYWKARNREYDYLRNDIASCDGIGKTVSCNR